MWLILYEARGVIVSFNLKWTFIWSILRCAKGTSIHEWPELTDPIQLIEAMRMCDNKQSKAAAVLKSSPARAPRKCTIVSVENSCRSFFSLLGKR